VHEYQHFLQYTLNKGKNEVRINLPEGLHAIDREKAYAKIYFELKKSKVCNLFAAGVILPLFSLIGLPGFIGSAVATYGMQYHNLMKSIALRKQYPKETKLGSFQRLCTKSRLAAQGRAPFLKR
jgi:hypothetical protein